MTSIQTLKAAAISAVFAAAAMAAPAAMAATLVLDTAGSASKSLLASFDLGKNAGYAPLAGGVGVGSTVTTFTQTTKSASNGLRLLGPAKVTFTYLGKEAGFTNFALGLNDAVLFTTGLASVGDRSAEFTVAKGPLDFSFRSGSGKSSFGLANDGGYFGPAGDPKKVGIAYSGFLSDKLVPKNGQSVLAFFDDSGGKPDLDFDDIGVRIDVVPVPLPAAGWMLIAGLGALGAAARKRKAVAA